MIRFRALIFIVLLVGLPSLASAQGSPFKWWQDDHFKSELKLSADQCPKLEKVYQDFAPKMKDQLDRLEGQQTKLGEVITAGVLPEADVIKLIDQVEATRAELGKTRTLMSYRLRQVLTPDQRTRLKALQEAREKERRQQGPVKKGPQFQLREGGIL
jgi:Spy/CpxP family protein refolding chaperone